jgi:adenosylcobinamide kinase/adenosylcobinamide-phosphate guanylyltransferase
LLLSRAGLPAITLVLGGARSGKSRYAEALVTGAAKAGTYIATAEAGDAEMTARIAHHRAGRSEFWRTVEAPLGLAPAILAHADSARPVLVDCLTLWVSNLLGAGRIVEHESETLLGALRDAVGPVVLVANEVGLGLVPETPLGRQFRDEAGRLNQGIAAVADRVVFIAAGLPLVLKDVYPHPNPPPLAREGDGRHKRAPSPACGGRSGWGSTGP